MIKFALSTSIFSSAALTWRMIDPIGSYATLFRFSEKMTNLLPGGPVIARTLGLLITDHLVGFLIGIGLLSVMYLVFIFISRLIRAALRRKVDTFP